MTEDLRCCGTGTCIINQEGYCWCGQKWDGQKMSFPDLKVQNTTELSPNQQDQSGLNAEPSSD